ncbi:hypothetical protein I4U23_011467 [Adineta vaga]|nr:hypothetical protein I4U23_011467 [Adineta vaga]
MPSQYEISDSTKLLKLLEKYLFQYGGSTMIVLGFIGCVLSCIVYNRKTLRKNPCSIYMTAFHISNFMYIIILILPSVLTVGYDIIFITDSLGLCRFTLYMAFSLDIISPSCLVLASIDRLLVTSPNALTRRRSTCRLACISVICVSLLWLLFHSHAFVFMSIIQLEPNNFICYTQSLTYFTAISCYTLGKSIIIPSLLASLGLLTIRQVQKIGQTRSVADVSILGTRSNIGIQSIHSKDRQLVRILLIDIGIYVIFTYPSAAFNLYLQITQYNMKSFNQQNADTSIQYLCSLCSHISYCICLYSNLMVSKTFRKEVKNIFLCK